jgi:hypothetical protein
MKIITSCIIPKGQIIEQYRRPTRSVRIIATRANADNAIRDGTN